MKTKEQKKKHRITPLVPYSVLMGLPVPSKYLLLSPRRGQSWKICQRTRESDTFVSLL
jgi:hypothetical protein